MASIPSFYLDSVVAIGKKGPGNNERTWIASGFLYGYFSHIDESGHKVYLVGLITNRHVFENQFEVILRFNPWKDEPAREYTLKLQNEKKEQLWLGHPNDNIDVAVVPMPYDQLEKEGIKAAFFNSDKHVADLDKLNSMNIGEGDSVYVLGFPLGLVGGERNKVIVRSGSIARIQDTLAGTSTEFLLDAFIFPGNSGGPVISKPEPTNYESTKSKNFAYLIGVVKGYIPYQDIAFSNQTNRPRVIFEENSGLAAAHPIDFVHEIIERSPFFNTV